MKKSVWALFILMAILLACMTAQADYLDFPSSIKRIEDEAFMGDTSIDSVYLPEGLEHIGAQAFAYSSTEWIYLPESIKYIAPDAFEGCENVMGYGDEDTYACDFFAEHDLPYERDIWVDDILIISWDGDTYLADGYYGNSKNATIPATFGNGKTVTSIDSYFYSGRVNISSIELSNGIKRIEDDAFFNCRSLEKIFIPQSVEYIGDTVFYDPENITISCDAGSYAESWANLHGIKMAEWSLEPEDEFSDLSDFVFNPLSDTTCEVTDYIGNDLDVIIPDHDEMGRTVIQIGTQNYSYPGTSKLIRNIILPDTIERITDNALPNLHCYGANLFIPKNVYYIGSDLMVNSSIYSFTVSPENNHFEVEDEALYCLDNATLIKYPAKYYSTPITFMIREGTRHIAKGAFRNAYVGQVNFPSSLEEIGEYAFAWNRLSSVVIPNTIKTIGRYAFSGPMNDLNVYISESVEYIGECAFDGGYYHRIKKIEVSPDNNHYEMVDGILYSKGEDKRLLTVVNDTEHIEVKEGTKSIDERAFAYLPICKSISLPDSVNSIGIFAFEKCDFLEEIDIKNGVRYIGMGAFNRCPNLKQVFIPPTVTIIGSISNNLVLLVEPGSYAETYAIENNIPYNCTVPSNLIGSFDHQSLNMNIGSSIQVSGSVEAESNSLSRVTLTIEGYNIPDDENDRYATVDLSGKNLHEIRLEDYPALSLDASRAPLNVPGTYTVKLWAKAEGMEKGTLLDTVCVIVKEPDNSTLSGTVMTTDGIPIPNVQVTVTENQIRDIIVATTITDENGNWSVSHLDSNIDYEVSYFHENLTFTTVSVNPRGEKVYNNEGVLITGSFASESIVITQGTTKIMSGSVSSIGANIGIIKLEIDDAEYSYDNFTGHNLNKVFLQYWAAFTLDTTKEPLNTPGIHTATLYAYTEGNEASMEPISISIEVQEAVLSFYKQPTSEKRAVSENVTFIARATNAVSYYWEMKASEDSEWERTTLPGNDSEILQFAASEEYNGYRFRCVAVGSNEQTLASQVVTAVILPIAISTQPMDAIVSEGKEVNYRVTAVGIDLSYQWQQYDELSNEWIDISAFISNTNELCFQAQREDNGSMYRCIITDANGNSLITREALLTVSYITVIINDPVSDFDKAFAVKSTYDNPYLKLCSMYLAEGIYHGDGATSAYSYLSNLGFQYIYQYNRNDGSRRLSDDLVAAMIAHKTVVINGERKTIYAVIIRGSTGMNEWKSNFRIGTEDTARGFLNAATDIEMKFYEYYTQFPPEAGSTPVLWTTGHSRGAAVANILAARLLETTKFIAEDDLYAYCFACPNVSKTILTTSSAIKNFNLAEDFVPCLPLSNSGWGYGRNGKTTRIFTDNASEDGRQACSYVMEILYQLFPTRELYWDFFQNIGETQTIDSILNLLDGRSTMSDIEYWECAKEIATPIIDYYVKQKLVDATRNLRDMLQEVGSIMMQEGARLAGLPSLPGDIIDYSTTATNLLSDAFEDLDEEQKKMQLIGKMECLVYFTAKYAPYAQRHGQQFYLEWIRHYSSNDIVSQVCQDIQREY